MPDAPAPWHLIEALWAGILGACVGSFLNVVIARVPAGESIVRPASRCPRCRNPIRWYDNVPVISWILLRARCRRCGQPISIRYPAVELLGAGAALLAWHRHGLSVEGLAELVMASFLVALAAIDLDTWLLPHALTWPLIALGLLCSAAGIGPAPALWSSAAGAGAGFAAFALVGWVGKRLAGREALGFGDVWLLAGLGAWLGLGALLPVVLLASTQGALIGIVLMLAGRTPTGERPAGPASQPAGDGDDWVPPRHAVPFGPFLALGALEWLYLGGWLAGAVPALEVFRP
jgi:leader peptidase (prepilin peptidase)/N-methyltransferase